MRLVVAVVALLSSAPAFAYIGPGAGVSFLGSLWALLVGIVLALGAVLFWPIRYLIRRARRGKSAQAQRPPSP